MNTLYKFLEKQGNQGLFVIKFFNAAGCHYFSIPRDPSLRTTNALENERHYAKDRSVLPLKENFPNPILVDNLQEFLSKHFKRNNARKCMDSFGISSSMEEDINSLTRALAIQFQRFLDAETEDIPNLVPYYYESISNGNPNPYEIVNRALYPGDRYYVEEKYQKHNIFCYENFSHTWVIHNYGDIQWIGRKLVLKSENKSYPIPELKEISIPDVGPHQMVKVSVNFKSRSIEGKFIVEWEMRDINNNVCFLKNELFDVVINVTYNEYSEI